MAGDSTLTHSPQGAYGSGNLMHPSFCTPGDSRAESSLHWLTISKSIMDPAKSTITITDPTKSIFRKFTELILLLVCIAVYVAYNVLVDYYYAPPSLHAATLRSQSRGYVIVPA